MIHLAGGDGVGVVDEHGRVAYIDSGEPVIGVERRISVRRYDLMVTMSDPVLTCCRTASQGLRQVPFCRPWTRSSPVPLGA